MFLSPSRLVTMFSSKVRTEVLLYFSPGLAGKTADYLQHILQFGDWLILTMMADHLDIKLFTDILNKIKSVHFEEKRHSSISTTLEIIGASDTDGETEEKEMIKTPVIPSTPASARRLHPPIIKKVRRDRLSW